MGDMNCGWIQTVLAVLILVFVIWPTQILSATLSWWIVVVSAALLLIHAVICKKCCGVMCGVNKDEGASMGAKSTESIKPLKKKK